MSAATYVTVEAYGILDLPPAIRDRVIERERVDAWDSWITDEVGEQLAGLIRERLDGVEDVDVTAWAMLHGGRPSMVVEGTIVDPDTFAIAVGVPGHDVGLGLTLAPHHGRGGQWAGTTDVLRFDGDDGCERDDVMSEALGEVMGEVLAAVASWAEDAESDESLADGLDAGGWRFDRLGRHLDAVIVADGDRVSAADALIDHATAALVEAARAAGREDRDAVVVWLAAADAAVTLAERARTPEVTP